VETRGELERSGTPDGGGGRCGLVRPPLTLSSHVTARRSLGRRVRLCGRSERGILPASPPVPAC